MMTTVEQGKELEIAVQLEVAKALRNAYVADFFKTAAASLRKVFSFELAVKQQIALSQR